MSNSPLVSYTRISKNRTSPRNQKISRITPHCWVGQTGAKAGADYFATTDRDVSSNYIIGYDGQIAMSVEEKDRSWCSSSRENDNKAITIECASDKVAPYKMNDIVFERLIELCVDICKRNGKKKLLWNPNRVQALAYTPKDDEMIITVHRWFANKSCPGDWLYNKLGELANRVTDKLGGTTQPENPKPLNPTVQVDPAKSYDRNLARTYTVTAKSGLHIRAGADSKKKSFGVIPCGQTVTCYGYYTGSWLYVKYGNTVGFCYKQYLK